MTIASPTSADVTTCIQIMRESLRTGGPIDPYDKRLVLAVLKNGVTRQTAANLLGTTTTAQLAILQAKGTNDASAEIDTADTTLSALVAALSTTPTYVTSTVQDG